MAIALGKRKRQVEAPRPVKKNALVTKVLPKPEQEEPESDGEDLQAIFRRAFEAKFKPLEGEAKKKAEIVEAQQAEDEEVDGDVASDNDAWDGISEPENEVEVIEHADIKRIPKDEVDKKLMKAYMSAKPPTLDEIFAAPAKGKKGGNDKPTEDDNTDAANLKNDLALQRLLNESHLLDSSFSSTDPSGKNRHKATELRLAALGSKGSILEQKNMPLSHRKGINAKKESRETERRRDAKENGIILERAAMVKKGAPAVPEKRARGIGGPSVGRFSGGTLKLTKQDVAGITGPPSKRGGKGGRGGRGGRGGGRGGKR